jgi:hypothetical protein
MAKVQHEDHRFSGEFMVQDFDHMSGIRETSTPPRQARQVDQSQAGGGQQGGDHQSGGQHGSERARKSR